MFPAFFSCGRGRRSSLARILIGFGTFGLATGIVVAQPAPTQSFDLGGGLSLEVRRVQAGTFLQGSPESEVDRSDEEYPRTVTLTQDYYLGTIEVTVGQFRQFASSASFRTEAEKGESGGFGWDGAKLIQRKEFNWRNPGFPQTDAHPVTGVTYDDALAFCAWLRRRTGKPFDLPTEAQWECAARAGQSTVWPGSAEADAVAWHRGDSGNQTHPVGRLGANAWGFLDMGGNAAEWCRDWYGPYVDGGANGVTDPWVANPPGGDKPRRVLRGGSWLREPKHARVAARYRNDPKSRNADNGFRVFLPASVAAAVAPPPASVPAAVPPVLAPPPVTVPAAPVPPRITPPQAPAPVVAVSSWSGNLLGMLCPLGCIGAVGGLGYLLFRKLCSVTASRSSDPLNAIQKPKSDHWVHARILPPETIKTEVQPDGFRMLLAGVATGELVRYSVEVAGKTFTDTVAYEPGPQGHFIYTGGRPDSVIIQGIAAGSEGALPGQSTLQDAGPGGHLATGLWMNQGRESRGTSEPRSTERPHRQPGAYE